MLPASLAACVPLFMHDRHVGLCQRRSVVGAVADHGHQLAAGLHLADELKLGFGRCLREVIVHPGFDCNRRRCQRVVAGNHDAFDPHAAQIGEALLDARFHHVFQDEPRRARGNFGIALFEFCATTSGVPPWTCDIFDLTPCARRR